MKTRLIVLTAATLLTGCVATIPTPETKTIEVNETFDVAYQDTWGMSPKKLYPKVKNLIQFSPYHVIANFDFEVLENNKGKEGKNSAKIILKTKALDYTNANNYVDGFVKTAMDSSQEIIGKVKSGNYVFTFHEGFKLTIKSNESKSELKDNIESSLKIGQCLYGKENQKMGMIRLDNSFNIYVRELEYYKEEGKSIAEMYVDISGERTAKNEKFPKADFITMMTKAGKGGKVLSGGNHSTLTSETWCGQGHYYTEKPSYKLMNITTY